MPECLIEQTGTILFDNQTGKTYTISVDGVTAMVDGDFIVSDVDAGNKQVKVKQGDELELIDIEVLSCDTALVVLR